MEQRALEKLDLPKVQQKLQQLCSSLPGSHLAGQLAPATDRQEVVTRLVETSEARDLLERHPQLTVQGCRDVISLVEQAARGRMLVAEELLEVGSTLACSRWWKEFFHKQPAGSYPALRRWAGGLVSLEVAEEAINQAIDENGRVRDTASPRLAGLRQQQRRMEAQIREELERIIRSPHGQKVLQEPVVTMRHGRYVVPVKAENQTQMPGLVHDHSASGATVFIEPAVVVELNNKLRGLAAAEEAEITRILQEISRQVGVQAGAVQMAVNSLAHIDLALAKGRLSRDYAAVAPEMADAAVVDLRQARHPLLEHPVPQDISLGEDFDTLIVTGPNTGGKTVSLKMVGLLVIMHQCGLHIPAAGGSRLGLFKDIFVDIGDEQNIEQSLSTFSAHLGNIAVMLKQVGPESLVLLDEIGAGTDPTQGAALARALLEYIQARGAKTMATTHYGQLKAFAHHQPRVANACMEFDVQTLQPTFQLCTGIPGQSHALEIAGRLGLPESVLQRTREIFGQPEQDLAELISDLAVRRRQAEAYAHELQQREAKLAEQEARYEVALARLQEKREKILADARAEARSIVRSARQAVEELRQELRVEKATAARQKLQEMADRLAEPQPVLGGSPPAAIRQGQRVFVARLGREAEVLSLPNSQGEVLVQVGNLRLAVPRDELRPARGDASEKGGPVHASGGVTLAASKAQDLASSLDLRGLTVNEALERADKYLDDALVAGLARVLIIHGRGTGTLRAALQKYLRTHPQVKEYRLATDLGSTEVRFEK